MRYYINTQHDGPDGDLISLALVREDGRSLYIVLPHDHHSEKPGVQDMLAVVKNTPESPVWPSSPEIAAVGVDHFLVPSAVVVGSPHALASLARLMGDLGARLNVEAVEGVSASPMVPLNAWWEAVALAEKLGAELGG